MIKALAFGITVALPLFALSPPVLAAPADTVTFGAMRPAYTSPSGNMCMFATSTSARPGTTLVVQFAASGLVPPWETVDPDALRWKRATTVKVNQGTARAVVRAQQDGYWRFKIKGSVSKPWFLDVWPTSDLVGDDGPVDIRCPKPIWD